MVDKAYCMSSFLMYRTVYDRSRSFGEAFPPTTHYDTPDDRTIISDSGALLSALKKKTEKAASDGRAALTLSGGIDYARVRVREVFNRLYEGFEVPPKLPMPRATNEWLRDWQGPRRQEFYPHCTDGMTGDQKWLVWAPERFLDIYGG